MPIVPETDPSVSFTPNVCGIVVTYHPDADVLHNLAVLRPQVTQLVVVDNGSGPEALAQLQQAAETLSFELIANGENLGIATALNLGCRRALALHADWLLLFDQDSTVTDDFTAAMLRTYAVVAASQPLGILVPLYVDRASRNPLPFATLPDGSLPTAMTSGSLLAANTFRELGPFADELFIDSVDHEYALRVRRSGRTIAVCPQASLLHSLGTPRPHKLFGISFQSTNHSPIRRYYQERNKIWMYRHYGRSFPGFCLGELKRSAIDLAKMLLVEQDRSRKARFFFHGLFDGLRKRMGRY